MTRQCYMTCRNRRARRLNKKDALAKEGIYKGQEGVRGPLPFPLRPLVRAPAVA